MDQSLINAILGAISGALGWFARELWSALKELKNDLALLRESIPKEYIRREDFSEFKRDLMSALERIENKLDNKQDR